MSERRVEGGYPGRRAGRRRCGASHHTWALAQASCGRECWVEGGYPGRRATHRQGLTLRLAIAAILACNAATVPAAVLRQDLSRVPAYRQRLQLPGRRARQGAARQQPRILRRALQAVITGVQLQVPHMPPVPLQPRVHGAQLPPVAGAAANAAAQVGRVCALVPAPADLSGAAPAEWGSAGMGLAARFGGVMPRRGGGNGAAEKST